jgi:hypothetical protein
MGKDVICVSQNTTEGKFTKVHCVVGACVDIDIERKAALLSDQLSPFISPQQRMTSQLLV